MERSRGQPTSHRCAAARLLHPGWQAHLRGPGRHRDAGRRVRAPLAASSDRSRSTRCRSRSAAAREPFWSPLVLRRVHWVRPEMVVEVSYAEWTPDGLLRHVVYLGEREDKPAIDVRRDSPGF